VTILKRSGGTQNITYAEEKAEKAREVIVDIVDNFVNTC
jgi:hypothetical protein